MAASSTSTNSPKATSTFWSGMRNDLQADQLPEPGRFDVVVVGAGIVGLTTGLLAARAGLQVAVVEAREPGAGTTGRSTAKATLLQGGTASEVLRRHGEGVLRHYVEANRAGLELLTSNLQGSGVPWEHRDCWTYAADGSAGERIAAEAAALRRVGVEADLAATDELPFETWGGVRLANQVQLDPTAYVGWLVREAQEAGAVVSWPLRAMAVSKDGDGMVVDCDSRQLSARWVVLATLMPFPLRTLMFAVAAPSRSYTVSGWAERAHPQGMYLSVGLGPTRSLRTATDASGAEVLLVGGHGHPTGRGLPASGHLRQLQEWGEHQFGTLGESHRWSAQDYLSTDVLPHIGAAQHLAPDRLLFACGFSKWGFTNGTAAAIALVATIQGHEPAWAAPLRPRIPRGWATMPRLVSGNLRVGLELVRGWTSDPRSHDSSPAEGDGLVQRHLPTPVAVSRIDGRLVACSAVCTHLAGIVRYNDVEQSWDCPLHGSRFSRDGEVLEGPAVARLGLREFPTAAAQDDHATPTPP